MACQRESRRWCRGRAARKAEPRSARCRRQSPRPFRVCRPGPEAHRYSRRTSTETGRASVEVQASLAQARTTPAGLIAARHVYTISGPNHGCILAGIAMKKRLSFVLFAMVSATVLLSAPWTAPRTPWGDPDLRGTYSNDNEYAMPFERPQEFAGKRASDLTPAELADIRRAATQKMVAALPGGDVRGPDSWWLQNLDLTKRSRPWAVVDPPDGKIPALTPAGAERASARVRSSFLGG